MSDKHNQVNRYDLVSGYMQKWPEGEFVYYSDYVEILAERDADKALIAESVVLFETLRQRIAELEALLKAAENNEIDARCHIAELQDRTLKFPPAVPVANWMAGIDVYDADLVKELLFAAGITLVVGE